MKKELTRAFETTENVIEGENENYDTSKVEPEHRDQGPADLLKTAHYYCSQGQREKGRNYFAYLLMRFPWAEEAVVALDEIKKPQVH